MRLPFAAVSGLERPWVRIGVVVVVAAAAGSLVWLVVRGNGSSTKGQAAGSANLSEQSLQALGTALDRPVYWAGPRRGVTYEFTETPDRRTYVRYLPKGAAAGTAKPFLTVGTYPVADAFAVTSAVAARPGAVRLNVGAGGVAFYTKSRPTNVFIAFPGSDVQIEVYDPAADPLHKLVAAGRIQPVGASSPRTVPVRARPVTTSEAALKKLSATLGRPIYWLGPIAGSTYELTRAPDGRVYVRYLPPGVRTGARKPYLTVATYPVEGGLDVTRSAAKAAGAVRIALPGGAVAFFSRAHPTSVYVAFPEANEQVEVFDPSARRAHELVASHRVQPVS